MEMKEFINLFACFIDKYSCELLFSKDELKKCLGEKARCVHYALQEFIRANEVSDKQHEYYDFFFENTIKEDSTSIELLKKYKVVE